MIRSTTDDLLWRSADADVDITIQLDDNGREEAVRLRAAERGLKLSNQALQFLLHHSERDLKSLMSLLARLDTRSLQEQKRLSVGMVKRELNLN